MKAFYAPALIAGLWFWDDWFFENWRRLTEDRVSQAVILALTIVDAVEAVVIYGLAVILLGRIALKSPSFFCWKCRSP